MLINFRYCSQELMKQCIINIIYFNTNFKIMSLKKKISSKYARSYDQQSPQVHFLNYFSEILIKILIFQFLQIVKQSLFLLSIFNQALIAMKNIFISFLIISFLAIGNSTCPQNCTNCPTPTSCTACSPGFFVVNQTSCQPCPSGCTSCSMGTDGRPNCTACASPAQLGPNGQCFLCNPACLTCAVNPNNCTSCRDGQQLQTVNATGRCGAIANCPIQNCGECAPLDPQNNTFCRRCLPGFFSFKRQCSPCLFSCAACDFNGTQLWPNISQFWDGAIRQTFNITTPQPNPGVLPLFMQNLNWANMTIETQRNWFEAFYLFRVLEPLVVNLTLPQIIRIGSQFIPTIINMTVMDQQRAILNKFNNVANKTFTGDQLNQKQAQIAASMTLCTNCTMGFEMTPLPSSICTNCAAHCVQCSSSSCTRCERGYFASGGTCSACTAPCQTCQGLATNCTSCAPPTSLTPSGTCVACQDPCATCSSGSLSVCLTCLPPYSKTPASGGLCYRCVQDLCVNCNPTNTSICSACKNGSTLINGRCQVCPLNCLSCSPGNSTVPPICFQCIKGFALASNGTCRPCGPGCVKCSDSNASICLECQIGLFLNSTTGICQKCRQGCTSCTDSQSCTGYQPGVIIIGNVTVNCRPGCKVCDPTQTETCTECQPRYFLDSTICKSCEPGCEKCTSATVCTQCVDNLILSTNDCLKCEGNCRTCNSGNLSSCLTCIRGTTLIGTQCRRVCTVGCVDCDPANSTICMKCDQGYALSPNSQCVKCLGSCSGSCDARNISICLSCVDGFELIENKCVRCSPGCEKCLNGQCSQCAPEFLLSQNSSGSYICIQKCRSPCATCNRDQCFSCQAGFILNGNKCDPDFSCNPNCDFCPRGTQKLANGSCIPCPVNCSSCLSGVCFQCVDGMFLDSTSHCVPCPPPCRTCYNNDSCNLCAPGFIKQIVSMTTGVDDAVYSDKCIPCDSNCRTCIVQPDRCTSCFDGFRLFSFRCAGLFTVAYSYQLNNSYSDFIDNANSQNFIETISNITGVNSTDNYVEYIREGSTIIGGTISASNQQSATTIQSSLGSSVSGYTVLSSSSTINYADSPYSAPKEQQQQAAKSTNIGLIVGVTVGGVVLIGIIAFIIYKVKASKAVASQVGARENGSVIQMYDSRQLNSVGDKNLNNNFNNKALEA